MFPTKTKIFNMQAPKYLCIQKTRKMISTYLQKIAHHLISPKEYYACNFVGDLKGKKCKDS